jgi:hypothetical protein
MKRHDAFTRPDWAWRLKGVVLQPSTPAQAPGRLLLDEASPLSLSSDHLFLGSENSTHYKTHPLNVEWLLAWPRPFAASSGTDNFSAPK